MHTMTVRGVDEALNKAIKTRARQEMLSASQWVLKMLREATGLSKPPLFKTHHDLDSLAGTWSAKEAEEFTKQARRFERIDTELWK